MGAATGAVLGALVIGALAAFLGNGSTGMVGLIVGAVAGGVLGAVTAVFAGLGGSDAYRETFVSPKEMQVVLVSLHTNDRDEATLRASAFPPDHGPTSSTSTPKERRGTADMARPIWSGSISFGLVNVPVKAFTAVRDHDVHFHQLDKKSGPRIRNRKVSEKSGKEVEADDIEMGFEVSKGTTSRSTRTSSRSCGPPRPAPSRSTDFVALEEIDPIYYERTYWLAPDGDAAKKSVSACSLSAMGSAATSPSAPS